MIPNYIDQADSLIIEINKLFGFNNNHTIEKIMKESVILREKNKFEFTKLLSASLELIANYCNSIGINRYQASHIRIETFKEIAFSNFGNELTTKIFYE